MIHMKVPIEMMFPVYIYITGQNCGTTYKNCIKNMLAVESGYLREKLS